MAGKVHIAFSLSLDKNQFLYTDHTDNTELSVKNGKKRIRAIRETCADGSSFAHRVEVSVCQRA